MAARIQVLPTPVRPGEAMEVRLIIGHPMESGFRRDDTGTLVARNVITRITCHLNGQEVFRANPGSGIAANPYFSFFVRAPRGGELVIEWIDDQGVRGNERHTIQVHG